MRQSPVANTPFEDMPTPIPHQESPVGSMRGRRSINSRYGSVDTEESPEKYLYRLIKYHDRKFKENANFISRFIDIMAEEHEATLSDLKEAFRDLVSSRTSEPRAPASTNDAPTTINSAMETEPDQEQVTSLRAPAENEAVTQPVTSVSEKMPLLHTSPSPATRTGPSSPVNSANERRQSHLPARNSRFMATPPQPQNRNAASSSSAGGAKIRGIENNAAQDRIQPTPRISSTDPTGASLEGTQLTKDIDMRDTPDPSPSDIDNDDSTVDVSRDEPPSTHSIARATGRKWTDEEEDLMIEIIHDLTHGSNAPSTKTELWQRASALLKEKGYERSYDTMMVKWSYSTRQKCEERRLDWAAEVMSRNAHVPRKRRIQAMEGQKSASKGTNPRKIRKLKKGKTSRDEGQAGTRMTATASNLLSSRPGNQMRLRLTWGRASNDVVEVDWSPNGRHFVAASTAVVDPADNDYKENRPRNLLHGSLNTQTIRELSEHREKRPSAIGAKSPNFVYQTVSAVRYAKSGHRMVSAGFDRLVRFWDVKDEGAIKCTTRIQYRQPLQVMDLSESDEPLLATGTESGQRSVRVFSAAPNLPAPPEPMCPLLTSYNRAFAYSPTCLKFGNGRFQDWLLGGFGSDSADGGPNGQGCALLWRFHDGTYDQMTIAPGDTTVFDCAWSLDNSMFAAGCASNVLTRKSPTDNSVVKLFSTERSEPVMELSCRAKDMNQVTLLGNLVTASCTDGATYVWDQRQPQKPLHRLAHGLPVLRLGAGVDRELSDVGVRFAEWDDQPSQFYTGGSDGLLKQWDTRLSPANVCVGDVANVGVEIMCGRFSPDHSSLLIGDDDGYLHLFSKSNHPLPVGKFRFVPAAA